MTEQRAQEPVREAREHTCRSQGENIRENMSMHKRRAQEPVPEVREKTCRSQGDTAAGGAGGDGVGVETRLIVIVLVCCE